MALPAGTRPFLAALLVAAAMPFLAPAAQGSNVDYCVTCKNPDETYRCRVTGVARASDALKLYCVIRTAKEGKHASCSAEKATTACVGLVKVYAYDGPALPPNLTSDPRVIELQKKVERDQRAFEKPDSGGEPKTLFQLGGRAVDASAKGWRGARDLISGSDDKAPVPAPTAPAAAPPPPPRTTAAPPPTTATPPPTTAAVSVPPAEDSPGMGTRMKHAAQNAGSAVGGAARKSYRCVLSLFSDCSGEEEE